MTRDTPYPRFYTAIMAAGANDNEREQRLRINARSLQEWRAGRLPKNLKQLCEHPEILRALLEDCACQDAERPQAAT